MFMGEYNHNLDEKSRIVIPSNFREQLGNTFIISKGLENCLYIYTQSDWQKLISKFDTLTFTKKDFRIFSRAFFSGANNAELDKSGRLVIPSNLIDHANIKKECKIIGANDRIEIWDIDEWNKFIDSYQDKISDIAENLFEESRL